MTHGPKLNRDWVGLRVKLTRKAANAHCSIAAGTAGVISSYGRGSNRIYFDADPCELCGGALIICGLNRADFVILTPPEEWKDTWGQKPKPHWND